jgi:glycosyltransferase involved in cell wall biosynthesis
MTGSISSIKKIHILIATYKRPEHLRRLLDSLANLKTDNITVAISVIDNDPEQTARRITANFPQVEYKSELQPGIPSARNASLDCMQSDDDAIVFIDDDESERRCSHGPSTPSFSGFNSFLDRFGELLGADFSH